MVHGAVVIALTSSAVVNGLKVAHQQHRSLTHMSPDAVARGLLDLEEKWFSQAASFVSECKDQETSEHCQHAPEAFTRSCVTEINSMVQGSAGEEDASRFRQYFHAVCETTPNIMQGWYMDRCVDLGAAVSKLVAASESTNKAQVNEVCDGFWLQYMTEEVGLMGKIVQKAAVQKAAVHTAIKKQSTTVDAKTDTDDDDTDDSDSNATDSDDDDDDNDDTATSKAHAKTIKKEVAKAVKKEAVHIKTQPVPANATVVAAASAVVAPLKEQTSVSNAGSQAKTNATVQKPIVHTDAKASAPVTVKVKVANITTRVELHKVEKTMASTAGVAAVKNNGSAKVAVNSASAAIANLTTTTTRVTVAAKFATMVHQDLGEAQAEDEIKADWAKLATHIAGEAQARTEIYGTAKAAQEHNAVEDVVEHMEQVMMGARNSTHLHNVSSGSKTANIQNTTSKVRTTSAANLTAVKLQNSVTVANVTKVAPKLPAKPKASRAEIIDASMLVSEDELSSALARKEMMDLGGSGGPDYEKQKAKALKAEAALAKDKITLEELQR